MKQFSARALLTATFVASTAMISGVSASEMTVNNGTVENGNVPFYFYYLDNANCKSQVVFPAEQLQDMKGSAIRELTFYLNSSGFSGNWSTSDMIVSLGETSQATMTTDDDGYATFLSDNLSVAYSDVMTGEAGDQKLTFKLSAPYTYNGSNLILQISLGAAGSTYPSAKFLGVSTDTYQSANTSSGSTTYGYKFLPKTTFVYGEQQQYEASVSATALTFPTTMVGSSATASVNVSNSGVQPLTIGLNITGDSFTATPAATTVASGETVAIPVTFTPTAAGDATGTMTIDLGEAGTFTVALSGKAINAPTGIVYGFNLADKTLPEGWNGWKVSEEYSYDTYDYIDLGGSESLEYFSAYTKNDVAGVGITDSNPVRDYPKRHHVYMISPAVEGNVMLQLASTATTSWVTPEVEVYAATQTADGTWSIASTPLDFSWASEPGDGWGILIGSVSEGTNLAVKLSYMAISSFAADKSAAVSNEYSASVTPEAIDFGSVVAGKTASKEITVLNTGNQTFDITVAGATTPFTTELSATSVEPNNSVKVTVTFAPEEAGDFTATLTLNMGEAGTVEVPVTGKAVTAVVGSTFTVEGIIYTVLNSAEVGVSGVSSDLTEVTIPASIENADGIQLNVVSIEEDAFYYSNVAKVTLPEGIRTLNYGAFRTSPLAEINLPSTLTSIGEHAFRSTQLTAITIPDGVTELPSSVFASCANLTQVTLPANLTSIGSGAFYKAGISSIEIPASCQTIASEAFEMCDKLTNITLPSGLTEISSMVFLGCTSLTDITIPATVTTIRTRAFEDTGLTSLILPASVAQIASSSFNGTPIATISVDAANSAFKTVDGVLYAADNSFLYLYPRTTTTTDYTVVDGCKGIIGGAFYGCDVKNVSLPETMLGIDEYAFCMSDLESINLPDAISIIYTQAFAGTKLSEVVLPAGLTEISDALFASCENLKSVTIPAAVTGIGNRAFYGCTSLEEIICLGETPAEFDAWEALSAPFLNVDCSKVTVYCPDGESVLSAYLASEWADFFNNIKNISDRPQSGIDAISTDLNAEPAVYYNLQGQRVANPQGGIFIRVNGSKVEKVAIR